MPSGRLPLHYAAAKCLSFPVFRYIFDEHPEAASTFDASRRLPLHIIVARCEIMTMTRMKCFRLLLDAYPEAVIMKGEDGRNVYDLAVRNNLGDLVLYLLLRRHPDLDRELFDILDERIDYLGLGTVDDDADAEAAETDVVEDVGQEF